jgi:hypothetical protein
MYSVARLPQVSSLLLSCSPPGCLATMAALCAEITNIIDLLKAREELGESEQSLAMETNMVAMVSRKILQAKTLESEDALLLYSTLKQCTMKPALKAVLQQAIDTRVSALSSPALAAENKKQMLTCFLNYATAQDWAKLDDLLLCHPAKRMVVILRLRAAGVENLHEQTIKWAVAVLINQLMAANGGHWPSYHFIYQEVQDFKSDWEATARPTAQPFLQQYPSDPNMLPPAMFQACYGGELPIIKEMPMIHTICSHMVLRSSSKFLKQEKDAMARGTFSQGSIYGQPKTKAADANIGYWGNCNGVPINMANNAHGSMASSSNQPQLGYHPATYAVQGQPPMASQPMPHMPFQPLALGNGPMIRTPSASPTRDSMGMDFKPSLRLDSTLAAMNTAAVEEKVVETPEEPPMSPRVTSESYETAAMQALLDKKAKAAEERACAKATKAKAEAALKKDPAFAGWDVQVAGPAALGALASMRAKATPKAKAKASAKAKQQPKAQAASEPKAAAMKRPAAAMSFGYQVNWDKNWKGGEKSWTSKHYHAAKKLAQREGQSAERCLEVARQAYQDAQRTWNHNN